MAVKSGPTAAAARRIPPTVVSAISFEGGVGYAELTDGRIFAFRTEGGEPVIQAKTACSTFSGISVTRSRVFFFCSAPTPSVFAFPRVS